MVQQLDVILLLEGAEERVGTPGQRRRRHQHRVTIINRLRLGSRRIEVEVQTVRGTTATPRRRWQGGLLGERQRYQLPAEVVPRRLVAQEFGHATGNRRGSRARMAAQ